MSQKFPIDVFKWKIITFNGDKGYIPPIRIYKSTLRQVEVDLKQRHRSQSDLSFWPEK